MGYAPLAELVVQVGILEAAEADFSLALSENEIMLPSYLLFQCLETTLSPLDLCGSSPS